MAFDKYTAFGRTARSSRGWLVLGLLLTQLTSFGQGTRKYLVLLRDKANTPYSLGRPEGFLSPRAVLRRQKQSIALRERDLPVNPTYVAQVRQAGATVWYTSRWLNAVLIEATDATLAAVQRLPFVRGLEFGGSVANARVGSTAPPTSGSVTVTGAKAKFGEVLPLAYGTSETQITQLGADQMHRQGYHGEGLLIGVLDAGFLNANTVGFLRPLFTEGRVLATHDFVQREVNVYEDDEHGTEVLSTMAATADGQLYGTAFGASYLLLRTEDALSERPIEEANWLFGAEYADSAGVDIINSSLGYYDFDAPYADHVYASLNGSTTLISRAAQWAAEAGMVVVNSAGNEGANAWRYITPPADAPAVLAVGGVDGSANWWPRSSVGPSADGRVKPDVAARGTGVVVGLPNGRIAFSNGTSFASPLVAGLAAGFWQAHPELTAAEVTDALRRSGSQASAPDNRLGYGLPNFGRASVLAEPRTGLLVYPNPFDEAQPLSVLWSDAQPNVPLDATLTNGSGRVVWRNRFLLARPTEFVLPRLDLSAGLYYLTLVSGDQKRTLKVLKR